MEQFLLRAKVEEYEYLEGQYVPRWAEGYLNLVGVTETGPKFTFAEPIKGECLSHIHNKNGEERYIYEPVEHALFDKKTVSRWTGILDKNGKKIFEGDIVRFRMFKGEPDYVGVVKYDTPVCLYILTGILPGGTPYEVQVSSRDKSTFEIIGNRWDNPELVEV